MVFPIIAKAVELTLQHDTPSPASSSEQAWSGMAAKKTMRAVAGADGSEAMDVYSPAGRP